MKAVIFDLFETLVTQWDPLYKLGKFIGVGSVIEMDPLLFRKAWNAERPKFHTGANVSRRHVLLKIAEKYKAHFSEKRYLEYETAVLKRKQNAFGNISTDVLSMIEELKQDRIKTCVVTNCEFFEIKYYHQSILSSMIDEVVFSCKVGQAKPDPAIYKTALSSIGLPAQDVIYVGDGGTNELQGAASLGIKAFQAFWFLKHYDLEYQQARKQPFRQLFEPSEVRNLCCSLPELVSPPCQS